MRLELTLLVLETGVLPIALQAQRPFITFGLVVQGSTLFMFFLRGFVGENFIHHLLKGHVI